MRASLVGSRSTIRSLRRVTATSATRTLRTSALASAPAATVRTLAAMPSSASKTNQAANRRLDVVSRHMSTSPSHGIQASAASRSGGGASAVKESEKLVLLSSEGGLRTITLNREKALNAINSEMVELLDQAIDECVRSSHCNVILLRGKGRALCSGGDVLAIVKMANSQNAAERAGSLRFFQQEFQLDYKIASLGQAASVSVAEKGNEDARNYQKILGSYDGKTSPKVFISMMDGITMGGGVGLSVHAPFRVATERTMFAMPETGIGYFPDVGVTRVLARLDGGVGQYLGMTGARISGEEAYLIGLATHYINSSSIDAVSQRLSTLPSDASTNPSLVASAIAEFGADPFAADKAEIISKSAFLGDRRIALDYVFKQPSAESVFAALEEISQGGAKTQAAVELAVLGLPSIPAPVQEWATQTLKGLKTKSPRSLKVTHQAILEARRFDVEEAFRFDMRLATAFCDLSIGRDFYEGVTHVLERDAKTGKRKQGIAKWDPPTLDKVEDQHVRAQFFGDLATARKAGLTMKVPALAAVPAMPDSSAARQARDGMLRGKGPGRWEQTHNPFALPSEAEVEALREGSHPAAGAVRPDDEELLDGLRRYKNDMVGLDFKVRDYLERLKRRKA